VVASPQVQKWHNLQGSGWSVGLACLQFMLDFFSCGLANRRLSLLKDLCAVALQLLNLELG
jgi:hypothetical protein